jgi:hypothetical protein
MRSSRLRRRHPYELMRIDMRAPDWCQPNSPARCTVDPAQIRAINVLIPSRQTIPSAGIDHIVADGVFVRGDFAAVHCYSNFPVARHRRSHVEVSWRNVSTYME